MTTTEASLDRVEEIVDEYLRLDLDGIFLRPLSPYGFAVKTRAIRKYDATRWLDFYARGLRYVLAAKRGGSNIAASSGGCGQRGASQEGGRKLRLEAAGAGGY